MKRFLRRARSVARDGGSCLWFTVQAVFTLAVLGWAFYAWVWPVVKFLVLLVVVLLSPIWILVGLILPYALGAAAFLGFLAIIVVYGDKKL